MTRTVVEADLEFTRVVLPLDGSELAEAARPTAQAVADLFGAAVSPITVPPGEDPAEAITAFAGSDGSVVVMSTTGRGRVAGAVLGSVARNVLRSSAAPVIVVGPNADRPGHRVGRPRRRPESWPEPLAAGAVVALVDGTAAAEAALPAAAAWAKKLERELVVLTIVEDAPRRLDGTASNRFGPADPDGYVAQLVAQWGAGSLTVRAHVWPDPLSVAEGVKSFQAAHPTALLALTASGRDGLDRLLLGATAADIVRASTAPALVIRPG